MPTVTLDEVHRNCELLRARCDRLRRWGGLVVGVCALSGALVGSLVVARVGAPPPQSKEGGNRDQVPECARARRFEVIGRDGSVVGVLGVDGEGRALFELRSVADASEGGVVRVGFDRGPGISLFDDQQRRRMTACVREELGIGMAIPGDRRVKPKLPKIELIHEDGGPSVDIAGPNHGPGEIVSYSHDGQEVWRVPK